MLYEKKRGWSCFSGYWWRTTDIAIFHDGITDTSVIPFGGNVITEDIKEGCTIMQRQAELLKTKFGSAVTQTTQEMK